MTTPLVSLERRGLEVRARAAPRAERTSDVGRVRAMAVAACIAFELLGRVPVSEHHREPVALVQTA